MKNESAATPYSPLDLLELLVVFHFLRLISMRIALIVIFGVSWVSASLLARPEEVYPNRQRSYTRFPERVGISETRYIHYRAASVADKDIIPHLYTIHRYCPNIERLRFTLENLNDVFLRRLGYPLLDLPALKILEVEVCPDGILDYDLAPIFVTLDKAKQIEAVVVEHRYRYMAMKRRTFARLIESLSNMPQLSVLDLASVEITPDLEDGATTDNTEKSIRQLKEVGFRQIKVTGEADPTFFLLKSMGWVPSLESVTFQDMKVTYDGLSKTLAYAKGNCPILLVHLRRLEGISANEIAELKKKFPTLEIKSDIDEQISLQKENQMYQVCLYLH